MGRWEPDARGRLLQAAFELMSERGYEATTVAEIAARAGLTERTFFRHFADKREVLFAGSERLAELFMCGLDEAPSSLTPIAMIERAVEAGSSMIQEREFSRKRQTLVLANPELQERERVKLALIARALAEALQRRGVDAQAAQLAAEMGVTVFRLAFERWIEEKTERELSAVVRETFATLKAMTR